MEILQNKASRSYDYISRYSAFPYYYNTLDNKYIYGTTAQLNKNIGYSIYVAKKNASYDKIALEYYNSPTLYWVICDFNDILDPFSKIEPGTEIKVPILGAISYNLTLEKLKK